MPRTTTVTFDDPVDEKLRLFMAASKMSIRDIANPAVDAYITDYLRDNEGVRAKYLGEQAKLLESAGAKLSLIKPRKPKNSAPKTVDADKETQSR
jgi:hypothetical protein